MLSPLNKKFILFAVNKEPIKKEDFMEGMDWPENRTLASMKYLQKKGILRIEEDGKIIFPGIVQKGK